MLVPRRVLWAALLVWCGVLALALLAPSSAEQSALVEHVRDVGLRLGFSPETATPVRAEFLANAAILAPVSALGSLLWARTRWQDWTAIAFVLSTGVELFQGLFLSHRTPSTVDVVANTLGGLAGALVVEVVRRVRRRSA
ncbi:VanZ family protein [Nocardioides anomalus]|uniref:VanZ family protein n=1 Tax=Nocardioides anomalus TaxID=2712223 RepID=A0A6G6WHI9_9ACTN|nr:VanZ family protein [Nocardioides anomalus]QIG44679.1 VanZ family protein [Nocardioides anomalus]